MTFLPDKITERDEFPDDFSKTTDRVHTRTNALGISAATFARAMSKAFADATTGGKKFDDVLRPLALRPSDMVVAQSLPPVRRSLAGGFGDLGTPVGLTAFAAGGVIATPTYFPL